MAKRSFVPRDLLVMPWSFAKREDVEWKLANDHEGAILGVARPGEGTGERSSAHRGNGAPGLDA